MTETEMEFDGKIQLLTEKMWELPRAPIQSNCHQNEMIAQERIAKIKKVTKGANNLAVRCTLKFVK